MDRAALSASASLGTNSTTAFHPANAFNGSRLVLVTRGVVLPLIDQTGITLGALQTAKSFNDDSSSARLASTALIWVFAADRFLASSTFSVFNRAVSSLAVRASVLADVASSPADLADALAASASSCAVLADCAASPASLVASVRKTSLSSWMLVSASLNLLSVNHSPTTPPTIRNQPTKATTFYPIGRMALWERYV